jgi:transcriptional regulator with XRE-family HTH domain
MKNWQTLRDHYRLLLRKSGLTQTEVARRGDLSGQTAISKLLTNTKGGPSVDTFVRAIEGLGISLVEFFSGVETTDQPSVMVRLELLEKWFQEFQQDGGAVTALHRRLHDESGVVVQAKQGEQRLVQTGDRHRVFAAYDSTDPELDRRVRQIVRATLGEVVEQLAADVDPPREPLRNADPDAPRAMQSGHR